MIASDPISYSRDVIIARGIDKTILDLCFGGIKPNGSRKNLAEEIDNVLKEVCNDCNLISGEMIDIPIYKCKQLDSEGRLFYVPAEVRRNRDIREAISLRSNNTAPQMGVLGYGVANNTMVNKLSQLSNGLSDTYSDGVAYLRVEDTNTIRITTTSTILSTNDVLVVDIENRDRLRKLKKGSYPAFYKICLLYMKAHLYNDRLRLKKMAIIGGHEITDIETAIDEFSTANDEYDEKISSGAVGKMLFFADESKLDNLYQQAFKMS